MRHHIVVGGGQRAAVGEHPAAGRFVLVLGEGGSTAAHDHAGGHHQTGTGPQELRPPEGPPRDRTVGGVVGVRPAQVAQGASVP